MPAMAPGDSIVVVDYRMFVQKSRLVVANDVRI